MRQQASERLGLEKKQAQVIKLDEEELLWGKGILGDINPNKLRDMLQYLFGLHFALRSGQEHCRFRFGTKDGGVPEFAPTGNHKVYVMAGQYAKLICVIKNANKNFTKLSELMYKVKCLHTAKAITFLKQISQLIVFVILHGVNFYLMFRRKKKLPHYIIQ